MHAQMAMLVDGAKKSSRTWLQSGVWRVVCKKESIEIRTVVRRDCCAWNRRVLHQAEESLCKFAQVVGLELGLRACALDKEGQWASVLSATFHLVTRAAVRPARNRYVVQGGDVGVVQKTYAPNTYNRLWQDPRSCSKSSRLAVVACCVPTATCTLCCATRLCPVPECPCTVACECVCFTHTPARLCRCHCTRRRRRLVSSCRLQHYTLHTLPKAAAGPHLAPRGVGRAHTRAVAHLGRRRGGRRWAATNAACSVCASVWCALEMQAKVQSVLGELSARCTTVVTSTSTALSVQPRQCNGALRKGDPAEQETKRGRRCRSSSGEQGRNEQQRRSNVEILPCAEWEMWHDKHEWQSIMIALRTCLRKKDSYRYTRRCRAHTQQIQGIAEGTTIGTPF